MMRIGKAPHGRSTSTTAQQCTATHSGTAQQHTDNKSKQKQLAKQTTVRKQAAEKTNRSNQPNKKQNKQQQKQAEANRIKQHN